MPLHDFSQILSSFTPCSLDELENVRLMNRTDTKYVMPVTMVENLLESLMFSHRILEINGIRALSYSTTYLDTEDFVYFTRHVTEREHRHKVRFRTYLSTGESFLEIKMRNNKGRTIKRRIANRLTEDMSFDKPAVEFLKEHLPDDSELLRPVLTTGFTRITLAGDNPPERITIDFGLRFEGNNNLKTDLPWIAVVELKSDSTKGLSPASDNLKNLRVRKLGFSKYCIGASLLYNLPHCNTIKPKLLLINKIENEHSRDLRA
jgi:hypothetical protein